MRHDLFESIVANDLHRYNSSDFLRYIMSHKHSYDVTHGQEFILNTHHSVVICN